MESLVTVPFQYSSVGTVGSITFPRSIEFGDLYTHVDALVPDAVHQAYMLAYLDQAGVQHVLVTAEQFKHFKEQLPLISKLLVIPTTMSATAGTDYGTTIDETIMGLHNTWFDAIIIGSGLAGLTVAMTMLKTNPKFKIAILDKETSLGGNSMKASSGLSLVNTPTQIAAGIKDSIESFINDTLASGKGRSDPALVSALAEGSRDAWEFLTVECGVDLSKVAQCGGHSIARTHRPKGLVPIGCSVVTAVLGKLEKLKPAVTFFKNCDVKALLVNATRDAVKGVVVDYNKGKAVIRCRGSTVFISTGGFGNDHTEDSLLSEFAPHLEKYPTTNGPFAQGTGIKIARKIGAAMVDMDQIQLHPTGFVDPAARDAKSKILGPELLRGVGGVLFSHEGKRFCNELGRRDYVTGEIVKHCPDKVSVMLLGEKSADLFGPNFAFYQKRGLILKFASLKEFCEHYKLPLENVYADLVEYNKAARGEKADPFGKTVFPQQFDVEIGEAAYYGCEITPTLHYTMGGLKVDVNGNVLKDATVKASDTSSPAAIQGLYAVGEAAGGLHGGNRLVGNSLMECVVFGRRGGAAATNYISMVTKL